MNEKGTNNGREVWWGNTLMEDVVPIDILEEWLFLNLFCVSLSGTQPPRRIASEKLRYNEQ